ncbi:SusC/RagA family TonB-linked outer membrane protein [Flavobacterium sp. S87F.05.LMB.W.Kidney.N]|uniref:SusC/RagA family TonB-linked outer membrane protein n=1 Tax=Flavobacterium sp. S87F.05.LMB.W.Kidney.N TaxID=1278758 RepID=UPI001065E3D7|nr:SusC/RagA family TonB-linked outer membrane protein [Flavobacterium sp. S87F.05.LMB.W.Kidney.N]TDX11240.1 TonB-linked SusC/RagA family outer membrane protein [Flavobacterium sp. S87F.05.LMB.W.Kidney.N]
MNKKHNSEKYFSGRYHYYLYLLLMRSVTAFIWISMCSLYANPSLGQNKIHVRFKNTPLTEVFSTLEKQTNYVFFYNDDVLKSANTITLDKDATIEEILNNALKSNNLTFDIIDKQVVVKRNKKRAEQLEYDLTGKVTDKKGAPLIGVNVILKGKQSWDITRKEGDYRMRVSPYDTIVFSSLGYKTVTVAVNNKRVIDATLVPDVMELHSVEIPVSNGYTEIPKERVTGAIGVMTAKELAEVPTVDIQSRLEGKMAGVNVDPRTGSISVRGTNSYSGTGQPLIVIDGFPQSREDFAFSKRGVPGSSILSFLNPDDVESITVLKDAAASSIWGSMAANGVIVITTKKGKKGEPIISFNTTTSIGEKIDLGKLRVMNTTQYIDYEKDLVNGGFVVDNISNWQALNPSAAQEIMFRQKRGEISIAQRDQLLAQLGQNDNLGQINRYLLRNSVTTQYDLSINGGNEKSTYYLSLGYNKDEAAMRGNDSQSYNITLNNSFQLKSFLKLNTGINYVPTSYQTNTVVNEALSNVSATALRPYDMIADENGNGIDRYFLFRPEVSKGFEAKGYLPWSYNYLDELNYSNVITKGANIRLNASLTATITDWLNFEASGMYTSITNKTKSLSELDSYYTRNMINQATSVNTAGKLVYGIPLGSYLYNTNSNNDNQNMRFQMNINKNFNENNSLHFLAGTEIREERREGSSQRYYGYNTDTNSGQSVNPTVYYNTVYGWQSIIGASDNSISKSRSRYLSYYGLGSYDFMSRYHVSGSLRFDDTNLVGASRKNRALPLWSAGGKWDINKEFFLSDLNWLSNLAFRITYGKGGSSPTGGFGSQSPIISIGSVDFNTQLPTGSISIPENPEIKWETTSTFNYALDYGFFNNRLRGSVDLYYKKTKDILVNLPFNPTYGWSYVNYNTATLKGNGIDLSLSGTIINSEFKWNSSLNFSYNTNEVTDSRFIATTTNQYLSGVTTKGNPIGYIYAYNWAGLDNTGQSTVYKKDGTIVNSTQGIASIDKEDLKYMGTTFAPYFGGFMNDFSFKNFKLGVQITYYAGHVFRNTVLQNYPSYTGVQYGSVAKDELVAERWRQAGDEAFTKVPGLTNISYNSLNRYQMADINVLPADNVRLQQVSLGYNVPSEWLQKTFIKSLSFNFAARNLGLLWVKNDLGIDPQYLSNNNYNTLPPQRNYSLQFNCSF